jgi:hypothetical protein
VGLDEFGDAAGDEAADGGVLGGGDEFDAFGGISGDGGLDAVPDHEGLLAVVGVFGALGEGGGDGPAFGKRKFLHAGGLAQPLESGVCRIGRMGLMGPIGAVGPTDASFPMVGGFAFTLIHDLVNPPAGAVDAVVVVAFAAVAPVGDEDVAVGAGEEVDAAEPFVFGLA